MSSGAPTRSGSASGKFPGLQRKTSGLKKKSSSKDEIKDVKRRAFMINSCKFVIDAKYEPIKPIGRGAYGVVCSAKDKTNDRKVAIKKITDAFEDLIDAKRILREVKLLRHFDHENVVGLRDMMNPPLEEPFNDVYIVLDLMDTDMERIIQSSNDLTDHHVQYFIYQVLRGLKYIHAANVIHRDLKPSNLLLNADCDLKICDFGLARGVKEDVDLTKYVVTRWYRAPELLCACSDYDEKIDIWSVGCILAELLGRQPLWPGEDYIKQMNLIFNDIGTPTNDDLEFISNEKANQYIRRLKPKPKVPWNVKFPNANPEALDLLERMLQFSPGKRISVDEALEHPYLDELHIPETETECQETFDFTFEDELSTKEKLQDYMWNEIFYFRPHLKPMKVAMEEKGTLGAGYPRRKKDDAKKSSSSGRQ